MKEPRIVRTIAEMRRVVAAARSAGESVGLVPTMGAFHDGHLSLMREAARSTDLVVVSLFVNPTQIGANEDLDTYPRDEERDARLAADQGVDVLFAPTASEVYPDGFSATVHLSGITEVLCGAHRGPHHFDGVATVVAKLFNIVTPDVAFFGQKDAQQVLVVRQMARDLNIPVDVRACPTVRESDGLAMSSRNVYLDAAARADAAVIYEALAAAEQAVAAGTRDAATIVDAARTVLNGAGIVPEYLELRDNRDLHLLDRLEGSGEGLLAVAAQIGDARLIDNRVLRAESVPTQAVR